jgi:hypothetical protein
MAPGPTYPNPRCKRIHLRKARTGLHRQVSLLMTAGDKVAVEDVGAVEGPGRIDAIGRGIDLPRITHPPASVRLLARTRS